MQDVILYNLLCETFVIRLDWMNVLQFIWCIVKCWKSLWIALGKDGIDTQSRRQYMITCLFNHFNQMMKQVSCSNQKAHCSCRGQYPDTKNLFTLSQPLLLPLQGIMNTFISEINGRVHPLHISVTSLQRLRGKGSSPSNAFNMSLKRFNWRYYNLITMRMK